MTAFGYPFDRDETSRSTGVPEHERWLREWATLGIFDLEELLARHADFDEQLRRDLPDAPGE